MSFRNKEKIVGVICTVESQGMFHDLICCFCTGQTFVATVGPVLVIKLLNWIQPFVTVTVNCTSFAGNSIFFELVVWFLIGDYRMKHQYEIEYKNEFFNFSLQNL